MADRLEGAAGDVEGASWIGSILSGGGDHERQTAQGRTARVRARCDRAAGTEEASIRACRLILAGDPRIGKVPKRRARLGPKR